MPTFKEYLQPHFVSLKYRPDVRIESSFQGIQIPVALIEVLSKNDIDLTVGENQQSLIDLLRFYRNFDDKCVEVYVLPTSDSTKTCPILRVSVKWSSETNQI